MYVSCVRATYDDDYVLVGQIAISRFQTVPLFHGRISFYWPFEVVLCMCMELGQRIEGRSPKN